MRRRQYYCGRYFWEEFFKQGVKAHIKLLFYFFLLPVLTFYPALSSMQLAHTNLIVLHAMCYNSSELTPHPHHTHTTVGAFMKDEGSQAIHYKHHNINLTCNTATNTAMDYVCIKNKKCLTRTRSVSPPTSHE